MSGAASVQRRRFHWLTLDLLLPSRGDNKCTVYTNITSTLVNISVFKKYNLIAEVFESGALNVCTKAFFQGLLFNRSEFEKKDKHLK